MEYVITSQTVTPHTIAAVRARVMIGAIAQAWKPALDQVWDFLVRHKELRPGANLFLYHHPQRREDPMEIDFGVQVEGAFSAEGNVTRVETPAGQVATTLHVGPYENMMAAHKAIHAWCAANGKAIGGQSWEIYGDWNEDPEKLETTIMYLLR